jgi:hypothetical protein
MATEARIRELIAFWVEYRTQVDGSVSFCQLKADLYAVRNAGFNGNPPLSSWPPNLIDSDDEVLAATEHYFLNRCWVGTGTQPAWQMRLMTAVYNAGKKAGVTPRHNTAKPVTPPSALQAKFQEEGIFDGEKDLIASGGSAPAIGSPPKYW